MPLTLRITHRTRYTYPAPVFPEPHVLRFGVSPTAYLRVTGFALSIAPAPAGRHDFRDEENNLVTHAWFLDTTAELSFAAETTVEIADDYNPLAFLVHPAPYNDLPLAYAAEPAALLAPSLAPLDVPDALLRYAAETLDSAFAKTVPYLLALTARLHADFRVVYRETGPPRTPAETFALREGSCRDLSWMMIGVLRAQGIAARFTSGYLYFEMDEPAYELHAWVEVFVPGPGWWGLDPSHGMACGNGHLPICASADPARTLPVTGGVRGDAAGALETSLEIERL